MKSYLEYRKETEKMSKPERRNNMKILVCTDGSEHSHKALEVASKIAGNVHEVTVIHIYEPSKQGPFHVEGNAALTEHLNRQAKELREQEKDRSNQVLAEAAGFFAEKNITVKTILKQGRAADKIVSISADEGYDLIVLGSRGLSGLKKVFLGSVSNVVLLEAKADVLIVK
jgi:nucleotide-binding universal stress UspA family protein